MKVGGIAERGERNLERGERQQEDALDRGGGDGHAGGAQAAVEQDLGEEPPERMAHDDRRLFELADDPLVMFDDLRNAEPGERGRIATQLLDVAFDSGPAAGDHAVAAVGITLDPVFPAEGCHPQAVDEDDGVGRVRLGGVCGHDDLLPCGRAAGWIKVVLRSIRGQ